MTVLKRLLAFAGLFARLSIPAPGASPRGHGGGGPGSGISSEVGWFLDGSYVVIVLGNYDLPGASAIYQKLIGLLASQ